MAAPVEEMNGTEDESTADTTARRDDAPATGTRDSGAAFGLAIGVTRVTPQTLFEAVV
jgi:hypothetical protein